MKRFEMMVPENVLVTAGTKVTIALAGEEGFAIVVEVDHELIDGCRKVTVGVPTADGYMTYASAAALSAIERVLEVKQEDTLILEQ